MQTGGSYLAAFNKATGNVTWKVDRNLDAPEEAAPTTPECGYQKKIGPPKAEEVPGLAIPDPAKTRAVVESVA